MRLSRITAISIELKGFSQPIILSSQRIQLIFLLDAHVYLARVTDADRLKCRQARPLPMPLRQGIERDIKTVRIAFPRIRLVG
ncbi:hypothetical protein BMI85_16215 [Thioclava sp. DLFJ4-1]|nr:hypothetical protein BMI85_16215 [Thioclava sp. DLFJ4-1]